MTFTTLLFIFASEVEWSTSEIFKSLNSGTKNQLGSYSSIGNEYAPHNTAVEAPSVSLKWHLRLSSKCHSAFHIQSIPVSLAEPLAHMS